MTSRGWRELWLRVVARARTELHQGSWHLLRHRQELRRSIFYRNAINVGLPIIECPEAVDCIEEGDAVFADTSTGVIEDLTTGESWEVRPFEPFIQEIVEAGGLVARTKMHR